MLCPSTASNNLQSTFLELVIGGLQYVIIPLVLVPLIQVLTALVQVLKQVCQDHGTHNQATGRTRPTTFHGEPPRRRNLLGRGHSH